MKLWHLVRTARAWTEAQCLTIGSLFLAIKKHTTFFLKFVNENARFLNSVLKALRTFGNEGRYQFFFFVSFPNSCRPLAPRKNTSVAPDAPEAYGHRSRISDYDRSNGSGAIETARKAALWNAGGTAVLGAWMEMIARQIPEGRDVCFLPTRVTSYSGAIPPNACALTLPHASSSCLLRIPETSAFFLSCHAGYCSVQHMGIPGEKRKTPKDTTRHDCIPVLALCSRCPGFSLRVEAGKRRRRKRDDGTPTSSQHESSGHPIITR